MGGLALFGGDRRHFLGRSVRIFARHLSLIKPFDSPMQHRRLGYTIAGLSA
jgi:hypothetical protein